MTQARDDFAAKLNGREYGSEMTKAEESEAKAARLLVVFGASDDLTEFRGIINDEMGSAYDGARRDIVRTDGRWIATQGDFFYRKPVKGVLIDVVCFPPELPNLSWLIKPSVPFAPFDILEDGELYCRGAVIDEVDLLPAQRVLLVEPRLNHPDELIISFTETLTTEDLASIHECLKEWSR